MIYFYFYFHSEALITDLLNQKEHHNTNNNDTIIDHPLEYGFEGFCSDEESASSTDSTSSVDL